MRGSTRRSSYINIYPRRSGRTAVARGGFRKPTSMAFRTRGNMIASQQQRDSATVVLQGMMNVPITVNTQNINPVSNGAVVGISMWQLLFNTKFWTNYKDMWDQVKMLGFRCRIIGNSAASTVLASGLSSVGVVTAIDRTSIPGGITAPTFTNNEQGNGNKKPAILLNPGKAGDSEEMINNALSYGSCKTKNWSPGNAFYQWVSCYPTTLNEKEHWIETKNAKITMGVWDTGIKKPMLELGYPSGLDVESENNALEASGLGRLGTAPTPGFNPVMLIGIYNIPQTAASSPQVFTFSIEYKIPCTFRGARSGTQDAAGLIQAPSPSGRALNIEITENGDKIFNEGPYNPVTIKTNVTPNIKRNETFGIDMNGTMVVEAGLNENGEKQYLENITIETGVQQIINKIGIEAYIRKDENPGLQVGITSEKLENALIWNTQNLDENGNLLIANMNVARIDTNTLNGRSINIEDNTVDGIVVIMKNAGYGTEKKTLIWGVIDDWGGSETENAPWPIKNIVVPALNAEWTRYMTWKWNDEVKEELKSSLDEFVKMKLIGNWEIAIGGDKIRQTENTVISIATGEDRAGYRGDALGRLYLQEDQAYTINEKITKTYNDGEEIETAYFSGLINITV